MKRKLNFSFATSIALQGVECRMMRFFVFERLNTHCVEAAIYDHFVASDEASGFIGCE